MVYTTVIKIGLFFSLCFIFSSTANAATYYFNPVGSSLGVGEELEIAVLVNPDNEKLNAFEGSVVFPEDIIEVVDICTDDSMIDMWLEQPIVVGNTIRFAGIVPGGFDGIRMAYGTEKKSGVVLQMVVKGIKEGSSSLYFEYAQAYRNDGKATHASIDMVPGSVDVVKKSILENPSEEDDFILPEQFTPLVVQNSLLHDGMYLVVFQTTDKGSGLDHYEIAEVSNSSEIEEAVWHNAVSPYVMKDQTGHAEVYVKAVDKKGNERIAKAEKNTVLSEESVFMQKQKNILPTLLLWVGLLLLFVYMYRFVKM